MNERTSFLKVSFNLCESITSASNLGDRKLISCLAIIHINSEMEELWPASTGESFIHRSEKACFFSSAKNKDLPVLVKKIRPYCPYTRLVCVFIQCTGFVFYKTL